MSTLPSPPDGVDLTADKRPIVIGASVATWILAVFAVLLRIISRRIKGLDLWYDDWLVVAALVGDHFIITLLRQDLNPSIIDSGGRPRLRGGRIWSVQPLDAMISLLTF
jgi:hypothetical protein